MPCANIGHRLVQTTRPARLGTGSTSSATTSPVALEFDRLYSGDCLELFPRVAAGSIDLVFADPPFNIGYDYDIYDDRREAEAYLDWTRPGDARSFVRSSPTARSGWRSATSSPPS